MRRRAVLSAALFFLSVLTIGYGAEIPPTPQRGGGIAGGRAPEVSMRFSRNEGFNRIVFETTDESFIRNTTVTSSQNQVRVQFPSDLILSTQNSPELNASLKGKIYSIMVNHPFRLKVLKLSAPARLSIDIIASAGEEPSGARAPSAPISASDLRIVLDPGHGGYELGIISGETKEKDLSFSLARTMESALAKTNRTVFLTRKADQYMSIIDRALFANQKAANVFLSIHLSLSDTFVLYTATAEPVTPEPSGEGYSIMTRQRRYAGKTKILTEALGKILKDEFKSDIVYRNMDLPLLDAVGAAAVLVEVPRAVAHDHAMRARVAQALVKGIAAYAGQ